MNNEMMVRPAEVLLVEDNPGDVRLTKEALNEGKVLINLSAVKDGIEAMKFLRKKGKYSKAHRPDIIFLDLNLPKKHGREVLAEVKSDKDLRRIPVVILTMSKDDEDVLNSYDLHANCYITKPIDLDRFMEVVQSIENFWLTVVKLPTNGNE